MKRLLTIALTITLLLAGCHHKREEKKGTESKPVAVTDTARKAAPVPVKPLVADTGMSLRRDTMPVHDRRRKPAVVYTAEQVAGEWVMGTLHEVYNADGTGMTWDVGEDVKAEEAKPFVWTLEDNRLTAYYALAMGGVVPHMSQVALVDSVQMVRLDDYGNEYRYSRAPMEVAVERFFAER